MDHSLSTLKKASALSDLNWQTGFLELGSDFLTVLKTAPLANSYWGTTSPQVAKLLGLSPTWQDDPQNLAILSGNQAIENQPSFATVYSGHQFGQWAGQLGDGRAIHLGTVLHDDQRLEVQLKGAGKTPYSRMGDGRAVLRSSIREFLCSEAMAGLGIPTTRALALTCSPAIVVREEIESAAVVTRVAPSFIRFGHFEHFASNQQLDQLIELTDFVIANHFPHLQDSNQPYLDLLAEVISQSAKLVAQWQAVGFCHGVLNTDNMSILSLTMDYGPFSFMDAMNLKYICNHSDSQGRYAYLNQPHVFHWNLVRLAEGLLPIIAPDDHEAVMDATVEKLKELLVEFPKIYEQYYQEEMRQKLGLTQPDNALVESLILLLDHNKVDYTYFFRKLCDVVENATKPTIAVVRDLFLDTKAFDQWLSDYLGKLPVDTLNASAQQMRQHNPKYILRQYLAQQVIEKAQQGDFSALHRLQKCLNHPFDEQPEFEDFAQLPPDWAAHLEVSCSS